MGGTVEIVEDSESDTPVVMSATKRPMSRRIKVENNASSMDTATNGSNGTKNTKSPADPGPLIVSATNDTNQPVAWRSKLEKEALVNSETNVSTLAGFAGQSTAANADVNVVDDDSSGEELVDSAYEGIVHIDGVQHFVCEGFKIRQVSEPFVVKRTLSDLNACIISGAIKLDPEYQRDVVWDESQSVMLISSILMGYFIPPVIFNVKKSITPQNGNDQVKWIRICVDGKQRLTSVWKFMTGQIGFLDTSNPPRKWYFCHRMEKGQSVVDQDRNILPQAIKDFFQKQYFCCYEYSELELETEETMFQLVQRGIALTAAEKMRAMSTEWATFTKRFESDYERILNLSKQTRASGFRLILTVFAMIQEVKAARVRYKRGISGSAVPLLRASPDALLRVLRDDTTIDAALKTRYEAIFDRFEALVKLSSKKITTNRWKVIRNSVFDPHPFFLFEEDSTNHTRTFAPLEFIAVGVLLSLHMDHRTDGELLSDIAALRKFLRVHQRDLRVNPPCWTTAWTFISEEMAKRRQDPTLVQPAPGLKSLNSTERSTRGRSRSGSSSSLSSVPSDLADQFEAESDIFPAPATKSKKRASKAQKKAKSAKIVQVANSGNQESKTPRKRAKKTRRENNDGDEEEMDFSASFPNLRS